MNSMDKRQTAIDWLVKEFNLEEYKATIKLAKAMEKEQIIDAFIGFDSDTDDNIEVAQAYYKEFYGQ